MSSNVHECTSELILTTREKIVPLSEADYQAARKRQKLLTKPAGSLGKLEQLAEKVAAIQRTDRPHVDNPEIHCYGADHGVAVEGVSAFPQHVTAQMVPLLLEGGAGVNALAQTYGIRVKLIDVGIKHDYQPDSRIIQSKVGFGTHNIAFHRAMSLSQCVSAVEAGIIQVIKAVDEHSLDVLGLGEIGIGNTTSASALIAGMLKLDPFEYVGFGSGISPETHSHKCGVVAKVLDLHRDCFTSDGDPFLTLSACGGFEIAALVGAILGGASQRVPVVLDGVVSCSAALLATAYAPEIRDYLIAGHLSAEPLSKVALDELNLDPICNFGMRLGEGSGAAVGIGLLKAACSALSTIKTFDESAVSHAII